MSYHFLGSFDFNTQLLGEARIVRSSPHSAGLFVRRKRHYLPLAKHLPAALHLAGILQPGHGLNGAAFLPAFAGALAIIIFPYMVVPYFILEVDFLPSYFFSMAA